MTAFAPLSARDVQRGLLGACSAVIAASSVLSALDALAGDGDLGTNMEAGFAAVKEELTGQPGLDIGAQLTVTGAIIGRVAPSTLGTLLSMAFADAGRSSIGVGEIDGSGLVMILRVVSEAVARRGRVTAGQRTIADAMLASCEDAARAGNDPVAVARAASAGAARGAAATAEMVPAVGRAAWVGERVQGKPDAGATAWAVILDGFYQAVAGPAEQSDSSSQHNVRMLGSLSNEGYTSTRASRRAWLGARDKTARPDTKAVTLRCALRLPRNNRCWSTRCPS